MAIDAAALRSELSARLGVSWGQVSDGHADIEGVPEGLLKLFSQHNEQWRPHWARSVADWVDDRDGAEPDPRTLYRLERSAVLASRPGKSEPIEASRLGLSGRSGPSTPVSRRWRFLMASTTYPETGHWRRPPSTRPGRHQPLPMTLRRRSGGNDGQSWPHLRPL